jgi:hypothetical protein
MGGTQQPTAVARGWPRQAIGPNGDSHSGVRLAGRVRERQRDALFAVGVAREPGLWNDVPRD